MNSDGDKPFTKIIDLEELNNFVVQSFFIWSLRAQIIDICFRSEIQIADLNTG
jgi:hypothetical protein